MLALPVLMQASPVNSVMQQTSMFESRIMVRKGSAMTKKAEGETGREVVVVRRMKTRAIKNVTCEGGDDGWPPFLELGHLRAAFGLVCDKCDGEEHHRASDSEGYVVACDVLVR